MRVEVYNNRGTLKGSTLLGYKNISLDECYKNSSKWMYNKIERLEIDGEELKSKLNGAGGSGYGEIYFQGMFVTEGEEEKGNNAVLPGLVDDLEKRIREERIEEERVYKGMISVNIVMGRGIKGKDKSGKSDPFVVVKFLDGKEKET